MDQVTEGVRMRGLMPRSAAEAKARDIFRALALPEPGPHRRALSPTRSRAASCSG